MYRETKAEKDPSGEDGRNCNPGSSLRFDVLVVGLMMCGAHGSGGKPTVYEGIPFAATLLRCSW